MNQERKERILSTIDRLGAVNVRQLHSIFQFGTYRNMCLIVSNLSEYLHEYRTKEKIVYLNKEGRNLIGSTKEVKKTPLFDHMLLCNDAYIYFNCPLDWKREYPIEATKQPEFAFALEVKGMRPSKKKIIPDAIFSRNGTIHLIEIDNTRSMFDNKKKIATYKELWNDIQKHFNAPVKLYIFTQSERRKREFLNWCKGLSCEVYTFQEIR